MIQTSEDFCVVCGAPLPSQQGRRGRRRYYCSGTCRVRAFRQRQRQQRKETRVARSVTVLSCPDNLYRTGAIFSWSDFNASLEEGIWPDGMHVQFANTLYEVRDSSLYKT